MATRSCCSASLWLMGRGDARDIAVCGEVRTVMPCWRGACLCCCRLRLERDDEDEDENGAENVDSDGDAGFFLLLRTRAFILLCSTRASCSYCAINSRKDAITASDSPRSLCCVFVRAWMMDGYCKKKQIFGGEAINTVKAPEK